MAPAAMLAFVLAQLLPVTPAFQYAVYIVTILAGALLFLLSLVQVARRGKTNRAESVSLSGSAGSA